MEAAHRAGLSPSEFWGLTPYLLTVLLRAETSERIARQEQAAWHAWHVAAMSRAKKMPHLKELMPRRETPKDVGARLKATLKAAMPIARKQQDR